MTGEYLDRGRIEGSPYTISQTTYTPWHLYSSNPIATSATLERNIHHLQTPADRAGKLPQHTGHHRVYLDPSW